MNRFSAFDIKVTIALLILGQLCFFAFKDSFLAPRYEARFYATVGIVFEGDDLHKLNEAAHYFGQTLIGWTKYPHFKSGLIAAAQLPEDTQLGMHAQERQNFVMTLSSKTAFTEATALKAFDYLEGALKEYNQKTKTRFVLTNKDQEFLTLKRSYAEGAALAFLASLIATAGFIFIRWNRSPRGFRF
jgi:hypothetical protein